MSRKRTVLSIVVGSYVVVSAYLLVMNHIHQNREIAEILAFGVGGLESAIHNNGVNQSSFSTSLASASGNFITISMIDRNSILANKIGIVSEKLGVMSERYSKIPATPQDMNYIKEVYKDITESLSGQSIHHVDTIRLVFTLPGGF